jgi:hypothetical protein
MSLYGLTPLFAPASHRSPLILSSVHNDNCTYMDDAGRVVQISAHKSFLEPAAML